MGRSPHPMRARAVYLMKRGIITLKKHPQHLVSTAATCDSQEPHVAGAPDGFILVPRDSLFQAIVLAVREEFSPSYDGQLSASRSEAESIAYAVLSAVGE